MKRGIIGAAALGIALLSGSSIIAQSGTPQPPPTWEASVANTWKGLHNKILTMAKDTQFPDEKLGSRPHPDSRSVLEEYRHVTIGLEMSSAQLAGTPTRASRRHAPRWSPRWKRRSPSPIRWWRSRRAGA